jgi:hypothetical protein
VSENYEPPEFAHALRLAYVPVTDLKGTREALCAASTDLGQRMARGIDVDRVPYWIECLQTLCDQIDVHRPLGRDGKHGDLHTPTCGCEDR